MTSWWAWWRLKPPHHCLLNGLFRSRSKKKSKLRVTGHCAGNSPVTSEFPAQMASNAENVSIWWRHHEGDYDDDYGGSDDVEKEDGGGGIWLTFANNFSDVLWVSWLLKSLPNWMFDASLALCDVNHSFSRKGAIMPKRFPAWLHHARRMIIAMVFEVRQN